MHAPTARPMLFTALVLCGTSATTLLAQGTGPGTANPVPYTLVHGATYQHGCFEPCACPITAEMPMQGTFTLTRTGQDPLFTHYAVTNVNWSVAIAGQTIAITGNGTYRIGGEFALTHRLQLDLAVGQNQVKRFDSGVVVGGAGFPRIDIVINMNNLYCLDTVLHVVAEPKPLPPPLPRHALFGVRPGHSSVELSLFTGGTASKLQGRIKLFLGDPTVPVIALAGMVGLSVDGASLTAVDFQPDLPGIEDPLHMIQDPCTRSIGSWNTLTGEIAFDLHLIAPRGNLPVPQPVHLRGKLANSGLEVSGDNGNVADGTMRLKISGVEVPMLPEPIGVWFSTEAGFHVQTEPDPSSTDPGAIRAISDGDLLSRRGHVVATNHELTRHLGIMPVVPDLGLDAACVGPRGDIWFSFEEQDLPVWSEGLARPLKHGDLLSSAGYVVRSNEQLLKRFGRMPVVSDAGLDAVARGPYRAILFSVEEGFFSETLGVYVGAGDLLSHRGVVVRTNEQLLSNFAVRPITNVWHDYGLDAILPRPNGEFWFSTEEGFQDEQLGWVGDGDLLSTTGRVIARNLDLLTEFGPLEDAANFGLDAVTFVAPDQPDDDVHRRDVNADEAINVVDLSMVKSALFQQVNDGNYHCDVNDDDQINILDLSAVKQDLFKPLPCPAAP